MQMLRAAHSIFDTEALRTRLSGLFEGLSGFEACRFFRSFVNDTYQLEAGGRLYYLRVYQAGWRTLAQARSEMALIEAVAARGAHVARHVARPVALHDGDGFVLELQAPEALRPAVLFEEAPGADLVFHGAGGGPEERRPLWAGGSRAALGPGRSAGLFRPPRLVGPRRARRPLEVIGALLAPESRATFERTVRRLHDVIAAMPGLTMAMCHGDLNTSNLHFDGETATVLDFDCAAWGWRANDISGFARGVTLFRYPGDEART